MNKSTNINWLESRRRYITATDSLFVLKEFNEQLAPKLQDINTWGRTRFQLYIEKVLDMDRYLEYQDMIKTPVMEEGKRREDEIAEFAKQDMGFELESNGDNIAILEDHKLGATPDYYAIFPNINTNQEENIEVTGDLQDISGNGILECKLTYDLTNDKLLGYEVQVQQQLLCTGLKWACIAIGIKESREINAPITKRRYHFIKANPILHKAIIDSASAFWKWFEGVQNGTIEAPKPDISNEKDKILNTFVENDIAVLCEKYMKVYLAYQEVDVSFDAIKTRLKTYGKGETFNVVTADGTTYRIPISQRKDTIWTEELKQKEISKIEKAELGSIKTKGSMSIGRPEIV